MLSNNYDEDTISERTYREWFNLFNHGDFKLEDRPGGGQENVLDDTELEELLYVE